MEERKLTMQPRGNTEFDDAIGVGVTERLEQYRIDYGKDGSIGSYAQRQDTRRRRW